MRRHKVVWIVLTVLAAGAAWAWRLLRDDDWVAPAPSARPAPVPRAEPAPFVPATPEPAGEPEPTPEASGDSEPAAATSDALTRLEGVGPKIAAALQAAGVTTFAAVADASQDALRAALTAAGLRFAPSLPTWSRQARLLADGDEAGFAAFTESLTGGRER